MTSLTLFLGDSDTDSLVKQMLEGWSTSNPDVTLEYQSIHTNPRAVVRLGITDLPALVQSDEILAQGSLETWLLPLLDRVISQDTSKQVKDH